MQAKFLILFTGVFLSSAFCMAAANDNASASPAAVTRDAVTIPATVIPSVPANGKVARAFFTSAIKNHEPVDDINILSNDQTHIAYFTEIQGMAGQRVIHRWEYNGKLMFEIPFQVNAARWRVYSTKTLDPSWTGEWKVSVVDAAGGSLSVNTFSYMKKTAAVADTVSTTSTSAPANKP
ncbi:MAG: DUF2914 domain-containing protein [Gammaproteobacteria bacterium]|nr:DUF2914 domain-containing protein [Gammaproteobacteria bacterium]